MFPSLIGSSITIKSIHHFSAVVLFPSLIGSSITQKLNRRGSKVNIVSIPYRKFNNIRYMDWLMENKWSFHPL